ncbi:MAG: DNA/RNA nuclease SfsA [bacterium]|nr:DNA/RNA nuclease SfsA [bacterium]
MAPADHIDPVYGELLRSVSEKGVELLGYRAVVSPQEIKLIEAVPVHW